MAPRRAAAAPPFKVEASDYLRCWRVASSATRRQRTVHRTTAFKLQLFHTCQTRYVIPASISPVCGFLDVVCFLLTHPASRSGISSSAAERNGAGGKEPWESMPSLKVPVSESFFLSIIFFYTVGFWTNIFLCLFYDVTPDEWGIPAAGCGQKKVSSSSFQFLNHGTEGGCVTRHIFGCFGKVAELVDGKDVFQLL